MSKQSKKSDREEWLERHVAWMDANVRGFAEQLGVSPIHDSSGPAPWLEGQTKSTAQIWTDVAAALDLALADAFERGREEGDAEGYDRGYNAGRLDENDLHYS